MTLSVKTSTSCVSVFTTTITFNVKLYFTIIIPTTQKPLFNQFGISGDEEKRKELRLQQLALVLLSNKTDEVLSNGISNAF